MIDFSDDPDAPSDVPQDLDLQIQQVGVHPEDHGTMRVLLQTSRGEIRAVLHPCATSPGAAIFVGGAMGGFQGPSNIYETLAERLRPELTGLRLHYRKPGAFFECVLDVLAGVSFLRGVGAGDVALVGHSFGGAVVIKAGEIAPQVSAVAALSSQLYGTRGVDKLSKPLLLVHGMRDGILDHAASEDIHARAQEPKRLVLYAEADHSLSQACAQLEDLLADWLPSVVAGPAPGRN